MSLTLKAYIDWVESWILNPETVLYEYLQKAKEKNPDLFAYVRMHEDYAQAHVKDFTNKSLRWAPIGIKDIILTKWYISSCGSKMLEAYVSPYSATCFLNLEKHGWLMIGKTNMDEFAMGSSTEYSYFWMSKNPYGKERIAGWSSWWSAIAVAADMCIAALGTDTGWSVRQPASMCGIVWLKPTYGRVSRYGVQAMASSFDQVGVMTKTVEDAEILLSAIAWYDTHDANSEPQADDLDFVLPNFSLKNIKVALPKEFLGEWLDHTVRKRLQETIDFLKSQGAQVDEIDFPLLNDAIAVYYILQPAEVSTNYARFDGIKFWQQDDTMKYATLPEYYKKIRSEGFGEEVKRRILLGTFVLSSAHYEGYYLKAQQAREAIKSWFDALFEKYDVVLSPTSPELAWKIWEKSDDPMKMYLADIYTVPANIAGIPAMSIPVWFLEHQGERLPVGMQLMAKRWNEKILFAVGKEIEKWGKITY